MSRSEKIAPVVAFVLLSGSALASPTIASTAHQSLGEARAFVATGLREIADYFHTEPMREIPLYIVPMSEATPDGSGTVEYRLLMWDDLQTHIDGHCARTTTEEGVRL